jgi:hypothetical protein
MVFVLVGAGAQDFRAGIGREDITPKDGVFLGGYAARNGAFKSVAQRIYAKALALEDGTGAVTLLITADNIGTPRAFNDRLARRISEELKIPRERFLFACSHSHSTPAIRGALDDAYNLTPELVAAAERYTEEFLKHSFEAAQAAVKKLEPVKLSHGRGAAHFAINRRQFGSNGVSIGVNPDGVVDRDVPVLRVERPDGQLLAVVLGYACHCTTLGPNDEVCGDWAGYAQDFLEQAYPGATSLFITGCGADANPHPRGGMVLARQHGLALAGAVARVLNEAMTPIQGPIQAAFTRVDLPLGPLPQRAEFEAKLTNSSPAFVRHAKRFLGMMDRGEALPTSYPCPVQVWSLGQELTIIGLGGEVVADYALRLQRELPGRRFWVAGYCNDVFAYVPSARILAEGGYEADTNLIYYGLPTRFAPTVEEILIKRVLELVRQTRGQKTL